MHEIDLRDFASGESGVKQIEDIGGMIGWQ
jgi:hypothetical protein